jgi:xanthine/CO dehydrogenase XdhC/CoxF family maturation factor
MKELREILTAAEALRGQGEEAILATVVEVRGSTYRRAGARLLLGRSGWVAGGISGGCLEGDVLRKAWWRTAATGSALVTYDSTADEDDEMAWGLGLGCNGIVRVLLERLPCGGTEEECFLFLRDCLASRKAGVLATVYESPDRPEWTGKRFWQNETGSGTTVTDGAVLDALRHDADDVLRGQISRNAMHTTESGKTVSVFWEAIIPPTPLLIFGAGQDTLPVIRFAKELGWHVTVVAPRALANASLMARRFPGADAIVTGTNVELSDNVVIDANTAVLLMTHQYYDDLALLPTILRSRARYVGVLGPRKRAERLLTELARRGEAFTSEELDRLHAPVGVDIGADTPEEIALSAVSEIKMVLTGRRGGPLRDRADTIHQRDGAEQDGLIQDREKVTCLLATP